MNPLASGMPACSASSLATPRHRKAEVLAVPQDGTEDAAAGTVRDDTGHVANVIFMYPFIRISVVYV